MSSKTVKTIIEVLLLIYGIIAIITGCCILMAYAYRYEIDNKIKIAFFGSLLSGIVCQIILTYAFKKSDPESGKVSKLKYNPGQTIKVDVLNNGKLNTIYNGVLSNDVKSDGSYGWVDISIDNNNPSYLSMSRGGIAIVATKPIMSSLDNPMLGADVNNYCYYKLLGGSTSKAGSVNKYVLQGCVGNKARNIGRNLIITLGM
jgi:hypothetical protein